MTDERLAEIENITNELYNDKLAIETSKYVFELMHDLIQALREAKETIKDWESISQRQAMELNAERQKVAEYEKAKETLD